MTPLLCCCVIVAWSRLLKHAKLLVTLSGSLFLRIKTLALTNFRRFKTFEIEFHSSLTVMVARNGAGKTTLLDGLAICLGAFLTRLPGVKGSRSKSTDFRIDPDGSRPPYMRLGCELTSGVTWDRTEMRDKTHKTAAKVGRGLGLKQLHDYADGFIDALNTQKAFELPVILYYGAGRGVFDLPARKRGFGKEFKRFDAFRGCLESRTNFRGFVEYFYFLEQNEQRQQQERKSFEYELPELKAIRTAVTRALPEMSKPRGAYPAGITVEWNHENEVSHLRIEQLSDGYRTTLAMIMDIAARMAEANPTMADPLQSEGVVLIDEIDLHLHPGWQQTILGNLQKAFPRLQFIVSTHSPQILTTVDPECIRVIEWQGEAPCLVPFSKGAEAQQLLQEVLGVKPRPENIDIVVKLKEYQKAVEENRWDHEPVLKLREELDAWGAEFEPELRRLDIDIRLKALDRS